MAIKDPPDDFIDPARENNPEKDNLRKRAEAWIATHPDVFAVFERAALRMLRESRQGGINALVERVRWELHGKIDPDDKGYRINNNLAPYISRALTEKHPGLVEVFKFRRTRW